MSYRSPLIILLLLLLTAVAYPLMRKQMLDQSATYTAVASNITVNYALALYLYGYAVDRLRKRIGKRKAWLLWGIGLIGLLITLRYVFGWETRW